MATAVLTEETALALQGLRRQGRPVALVTVGEERIPPELLEGLPVAHRLGLEGVWGSERGDAQGNPAIEEAVKL